MARKKTVKNGNDNFAEGLFGNGNRKVIGVSCPHCGKDLTTEKVKIDEQPCVEIHTTDNKIIYLSSVWNNFKKMGDKIPKGEMIKAICPHCGKDLNTALKCETCGSPIILLEAENGIIGKVGICAMSGCHEHKINEELPITVPPII